MIASLEAIRRLADALERLGIPYFVVGAVAAAVHGERRATQDIDVVIDLSSEDVPRLKAALGAEFEVDEVALTEAVRLRASTNLFFLPVFTVIDTYLARRGAFHDSQMARRQRLEIPDAPGSTVAVASAEDLVLAKLDWFRRGGEVSERQWSDVLGVLRVSGAVLDRAYLASWAASLGVSDLLERAWRDASAGE